MHTSNFYTLVAFLAATAGAQSTTTATVLVPDWCVTQAQPSVTVLGQQDDLTTYSYICSTNAAAASSASAHVSGVIESARSRWENDARVTGWVRDSDRRRSLNDFELNFKKRDDDCYGWNAALEGCIPWKITQGAGTWAVHYTVTATLALDQECTFGSGGIASGPATCTASGRLDPSVWGNGDGPRTRTFSKSDVDRFWIRNTVPVTAGGNYVATSSGSTTTGTVASSSLRTATVSAGALSTGVGVPISIPTGAVAVAVGAGGILAAALVL
ncbi:hypothetical protein BKA66DRAFT_461129 [Pyrenochaeta sp. MPI-SDFR-AT-0127]|nr:hypothetical protein BKA66DRAFT_461129 [Pyrenochaeta sp. MPI-SDFR-AT-0127]